MNFRKLIVAAFVTLGALACKKEGTSTVSPSLEGMLDIKGLPEFVSPGQTVSLTPEGIIHPEGGDITYTWKVSPTKPKTETGYQYNFTFSDTLQTCTIYCSASAEGYSGASLSLYATVVKGGINGSIKGIDFPTGDNVPAKDGTYYFKQIGSQTWMMNNVAEKDYGKAYRNSEVMSDVLGRYYSYADAVAVCESLSSSSETWALPTIEDWRTLESHIKSSIESDPTMGKSLAAALMADATFNSNTMWQYRPEVGDITNASGFSALPAGYTNLKGASFDGVNEYAAFWTATEGAKADEAYSVYLYYNQPDLFVGSRDKESFGASVRCIRK